VLAPALTLFYVVPPGIKYKYLKLISKITGVRNNNLKQEFLWHYLIISIKPPGPF
jgi:hypothetical protein